jgi:ribonuclease D
MPAFLAELERAEEVFLDTEADNMYHFKMRVCLLQFLLNGRVWLVDAQAPLDLAPLWRLLARKHLVMHGCDFDLRLLHALCGFEPESVFDTMLAAQLLNRPRVGLASLIEQHFGGVEMDKKCQRANWSERPFTRRLLDYAAGDVVYLPGLRDLLAGELRALGRLGWLEQQCRQQIQSAKEGFPEADENAWRIGRSERLRGRGLGVLHAVWHWRQKWAERLDVPPFKVCGNDLLLRLAAAAENGADAAGVLGGVHLGRRHDRLSPGLREAVAAGLAADPRSLPRRRRPRPDPLTQEEIALMDRIRADRDRVAGALNMDPTLIASRGQLAQIARAPGNLSAILLPWQAGLLAAEPSLAGAAGK